MYFSIKSIVYKKIASEILHAQTPVDVTGNETEEHGRNDPGGQGVSFSQTESDFAIRRHSMCIYEIRRARNGHVSRAVRD